MFDGKTWETFSRDNVLSVNEVGDGAAAVDRNGDVWFGLRGGGACRFHGRQARVFDMKDGLAGNFVYAISEGPGNKLWFGCSPDPEETNRDGGISVFDGTRFENFTGDYTGGKYVGGGNSLLSDNRVYAIVFDRSGSCWIGTKGGGVCELSLGPTCR